MALTLKVGFPPGHPAAHSIIKVEPNATVEETLKSIAQKQNILNPDQYLLYLPSPNPTWLEKSALMSSYPLKAQSLIEFKRRHQMVRIAGPSTTHTLLLDVTRPLQEFMRWVAVKFLIDESDIPNWSLYNKGTELNLDKSVAQQSAESSFHFYLVKKGEHPDLVHHEAAPATPGSPHFTPEEDEPALNGSAGIVTRDRKDSVFDSDNPDLQVPAKSLTNPAIEGYLKKLTTKKEWKKRYFVLKDKNLYYYSSPQDRKASGLIALSNYAAKPTNLQAKEAKYWAFELYATNKIIPPKSPRKETKDKEKDHSSFILRCESEQEMHAWLAAIRGDNNTPKLAPTPVQDKKGVKGKAGPATHAVFGVDLIKSVPYGAQLPSIVEQAIKYIDAKALDTVGIYRLSGAAPTIANWKKLFDKGEKVDLNQEPDPHAVAGLLKLFLRELPEPILTFAKYDDFIAAISHTTKWAKVRAIREVAKTIQGINRNVLLTLVQHLRRVNAKCEINKMHLANLATVFGPTLLRKPNSGNEGTGFDVTVLTMVVDTPLINELCMSMIEDYDYIFGGKVIPQSALFAKALYAYNGEDQNTELSFEAGSIIRVTQATGQKDQWWVGQVLLSPNSDFIGKAGCFPGSYVELVPGTSADWIALSALYTLTEDVEANRGQIVGLQTKVEALTKANAEAAKDKEESAIKGEKKQQAIAEAVGINPQLTHLWEHMDELVKNLASYTKATSLSEIEQNRHAILEELEQLSNGKFKNKADKENYAAKLETVRASLEAEKAARAKLSLTSSILLKDVEFIRSMLR